jgi:hypothetical protein
MRAVIEQGVELFQSMRVELGFGANGLGQSGRVGVRHTRQTRSCEQDGADGRLRSTTRAVDQGLSPRS